MGEKGGRANRSQLCQAACSLASAKCRKRVVPNEEGNDTYQLPAQRSSTGSHGQLHADKGVSERREPGPQWNQDYKNMKVPGKGFPEYRKSWNITPWMVMKSTRADTRGAAGWQHWGWGGGGSRTSLEIRRPNVLVPDLLLTAPWMSWAGHHPCRCPEVPAAMGNTGGGTGG